MKAVRQFALILLVLLPLLMPTMACALPSTHLTAAEHACCKQMHGECGSMGMPASHGCCHKEVSTAVHWNAAQLESAHVQITLGAISNLPPTALLQDSVAMRSNIPQQRSTLPQSPPSSVSVLRI